MKLWFHYETNAKLNYIRVNEDFSFILKLKSSFNLTKLYNPKYKIQTIKYFIEKYLQFMLEIFLRIQPRMYKNP